MTMLRTALLSSAHLKAFSFAFFLAAALAISGASAPSARADAGWCANRYDCFSALQECSVNNSATFCDCGAAQAYCDDLGTYSCFGQPGCWSGEGGRCGSPPTYPT